MNSSIQSPHNQKIQSPVWAVTVFLNKAQITRRVRTQIEAGTTQLIFSGLPSQLDPESIQAGGQGKFTLLGISHQQNYLEEMSPSEEITRLRQSLKESENTLRLETSQREAFNKEEQLLVSNQKIGGTQQNLTVQELKTMADFYRTRLLEIGQAKIGLDQTITELQENITRIKGQMQEQQSAREKKSSEIIVSVQAEAPAEVSLEVQYVVPDAGWYPVYDLVSTDTGSPLQLRYKAQVHQHTGEDWQQVQLTLSSYNPALSGRRPELQTWYVDFPKPLPPPMALPAPGAMPVMARKLSAPAGDWMEAEAEAPAPFERVSDSVQTISGTLTTAFAIALPYTVPSSRKPTLVDVSYNDLATEYEYIAAPKLDPDAFLIAKGTGWEALHLLPGEASVFFGGSFIGKTFLNPNQLEEHLTVSLGRDKRLIIKRERVKDYTSRSFLGNSRKEIHAYEISVRNTKNEPVRLTLEDQIPVSKTSEIEVKPTDTGGANYEAETGKLKWQMTVKPAEMQRIAFRFEVKYPSGKSVVGL